MGKPACKEARAASSASTSPSRERSPLAARRRLSAWLSTVARSARTSSSSRTPKSSSGLVPPTTLSSVNARSTKQTASASRIPARNRLPSPSPDAEPATSPAMSTISTVAWTTLRLLLISARASSRWSSTRATPTLVSVVENGWAATRALPPVRALNRLDLPALGRPTRPNRSIDVRLPAWVRVGACRSERKRRRPKPIARRPTTAASPTGAAERSLVLATGRCSPRPGDSPPLQDSLEHRRTVGHDPVHAEVDQLGHRVGLVDRPHVHGEAKAVSRVDEPLVDDGQRLERDRHLEGGMAHGRGFGPAVDRPQELGGRECSRRRRDLRREGGERLRGAVVERRHDHVVAPAVVPEQAGQRRLIGRHRRRRLLDVKVRNTPGNASST